MKLIGSPSTAVRPTRLLLAIAFVGFVSLGLPDAVIGVAWPSVRQSFELPLASLGLVFLFGGSGYFLSSFFTGRLVQSLGIGWLLAGSTLLVAAAALGYSTSLVWAMFVGCALLQGLGSGAIDGGLNSFAAEQLSAWHMIWLHACYCLGAMLGPLVMTGNFAVDNSWRAGYAQIGAAMLALSLLFVATHGRWGRPPARSTEGPEFVSMADTLKHPVVWLQMVVFFIYTGLEVTVGQWSYTVLTAQRGVPENAAGVWVAAYWASIGVGRVLLGFVTERVGLDRLLRLSTIVALAGAIVFTCTFLGSWSSLGLILLGLALAPMYPCLMTRTPQRLGASLAAHAVGFQVSTAMVGAAAMPGLVGLIIEQWGLQSMASSAVVLAASLLLLHEGLMRATKSLQ